MPSAELYITLGELDCRAIIRSEGEHEMMLYKQN